MKNAKPLIVLIGILFVLCMISLVIGVSTNSVSMVLISRLPRTLAAVLTGAGIAIAGLVMQTLARSRYVDPMIAGTGQSAALGLLCATVYAPHLPIIIKAFIGSITAFLGTTLFLMLTRQLPQNEPFLVALFALIYGGIVGAIVTGLAWHYDLLQFLDVWMNGEFSGVMRGRYEMLWVSIFLIVAAWWIADRFTLLSLGKETSIGLGLNYQATLHIGLIIIALIAGISVVSVGIMPFVGLVVPAFVSRFYGDNVRFSIPVTAFGGACLVLMSDVIGRLIKMPYEIPAGTILGVVGAIGFLIILFYRPAQHG